MPAQIAALQPVHEVQRLGSRGHVAGCHRTRSVSLAPAADLLSSPVEQTLAGGP
jgi:hypothetical protein